MARFSPFSIPFSVAILVIGAGSVRGYRMTRSTAGPKLHRRTPEVRFIHSYIRSIIEAQDELRFEDEVRFRAAEALYQRKLYPLAAKFYRCLLNSASKHHRKQAIQRLYEIANYWLQDSWELVIQSHDFRESEWLDWIHSCDLLSDILPDLNSLFLQALLYRNLLHWDKSKPFFNEEGRAIELLRCVHDHNPAGPHADKTLFLMGYVAWFHEDYRRADECFSRLEKKHPASPLYTDAIELAIKSKLMTVDRAGERKRLEEARRLIHKALKQPKLSEDRNHGLLRLLVCVADNLSDMDFQEAEKCRLAGRLDEARSRYQRIREDYPDTSAAVSARLQQLKMLRRRK